MQSQIKNQVSAELVSRPQVAKKEKIGRWSSAECYLFQSLLQRFGKNWKKIQDHMKNRSLGQIRSHAQKYFDKIGPKKVEDYERRAKLLDAYQTLQKEKLFKEETISQNVSNEPKAALEIKQEEESPITTYCVQPENTPSKKLESSNIKEQQVKLSENLKDQNQKNISIANSFPFFSDFNAYNGGYLLQIIGNNPEPFFRFQGIEPYVDCAAFRGSMFQGI